MKRLLLALLLATPAYAQTYEPELLPAQIQGSPQTMIPLSLGDDATRQVDLGFTFKYWGQDFTSVWVSSNGFISFGTSSHLCCNGNPTETAPRNTIYGFWTDLISWSGAPYYRRSQGSILFGWYDTVEYGTGNVETFEIGLADDNKIMFNYGNLNLSYHAAMAGITGPGPTDNISLFYGRNPSALSNHSGLLKWTEPEPIITVDCNITPLDPSCPPQMIAPVQVVTLPGIATIQDAATADIAADTVEVAAATIAEPVQEIAVSQAVQEAVQEAASITEQVAEAVATETATAEVASTPTAELQPERLTPDQVAALSAVSSAQDAAQAGPEMAAMSVFSGAAGGFTSGGTSTAVFASQASSASVSAGSTIETATSSNSPSSMANTLEVLNMSSAPVISSGPSQSGDQQNNGMADNQTETMTAMSAVPGFSAYTQVSLQDRPDFYALRDIYKNRRIRDNNFEMYRMTRSNSDTWQEMVNEQYGR